MCCDPEPDHLLLFTSDTLTLIRTTYPATLLKVGSDKVRKTRSHYVNTYTGFRLQLLPYQNYVSNSFEQILFKKFKFYLYHY